MHHSPALLFVSLVGWLTLGLALGGCDERPVDGPFITRVEPASASPGERIRVEGQGFGPAGHVAIGGRPIAVESRDDTRIILTLPVDLSGGETLLVVFAAGRPSPPFPMDVRGEPGAPERPREFPPDLDPDDGVPPGDGGPDDRGVLPDLGPPDDLVARFTPDPSGAGAVYLEALPGGIGELLLAVRVPEAARGVALHLAYDRGLLRFAEAQPRSGRTFVAAEIGPGRLALGRVFGGAPELEATTVLRFVLVGPGEGRVDVPARRLMLRATGGAVMGGARAAGGGLRVERAP